MGWFLHKPKTPKRNTRTGTEYEQWSRELTMRRLQTALWLSIAMFLALGWYLGEDRLIAFAGMRGKVVERSDVSLVDAPVWLSPTIRSDLTHLVATHITPDPLDGACLQKAAKTLALNPWIATVDRIRRTDQGLEVWATYRQPVALVRLPRNAVDRIESEAPIIWEDRFRLIDREGHLLPSDSLGVIDPPYEAKHLKDINLPVIVDATKQPPSSGEHWNDPVVKAGVKLVSLLHGESFHDQVQAYGAEIDQRDRIRLVMHTRRKGKVRWGLPPGEENAIEHSAEIKRKKLVALNQIKGSIDAGGRVVDVFGPGIIIHPASDARTAEGWIDRLHRGESVRQSRYDPR